MYQAFARKYRPQTWETVVGQAHITTTLRNALSAGRLHHAYLFTGGRGVGKTTVARILAKALNCTERAASPEPCNRCPSCTDIIEGRSLDIQEIDGASHTGVDDVRDIRERVKYLPTAGQYKVYIIDEVHMLSNAAFNALLKTIEEPPPHVIFTFATTEPEKIPATIVSRCQRYDFRRISVTAIATALQQIAMAEGVTAAPEVLHLIAYEADGSLRDAESLFDQAVAFAGTTVQMDTLRGLLGFTDRTTVMQLCQAIVVRDATTALGRLEEGFQHGLNLSRLAQEILELFRSAWILASCGTLPSGDELPVEEVAQLAQLTAHATLPEFHQWFTLAYRGVDDIARSKFPKLTMEALLLQMIQVGPVQSVDDLLARVEEMMQSARFETRDPRPETKVVAGPESRVPSPEPDHIDSHGQARGTSERQRAPRVARMPSPTPQGAVRGNAVAHGNLPSEHREREGGTQQALPVGGATQAPVMDDSDWTTFLDTLRATKPQVVSILEHGELVAATPERVELCYPKDSIYGEMLKEVDRLKLVQQLLSVRFGTQCQLIVTATTGPAADETRRQARQEKQRRQQETQTVATQHLLVKEAANIFGAEIKEIKSHEPDR